MQRLLTIFTVLLLTWCGGFAWFLITIASTEPSSVKSDAIVVFTGTGGDRMPTGMRLIGEGYGARLLISGVNPEVAPDDIKALWAERAELFDCCVDLGAKARTTRGNAVETREWTTTHSFESLVLVTSDYHMPRAMLELESAMPNINITAHPVASVFLNEHGAPNSLKSWRLLSFEYMKYMAVRLNTIIS